MKSWSWESKMPTEINPPGILFWRRPTLARPIAVLPSGLQRFTAVFGMGTGGATALLSPEIRAGLAVSALRADADLWRRCRSVKELWFSDIYIQGVKANI